MKKIIVFGGTGFLGEPTCIELVNRGYEVIIYDLKEPAKMIKDYTFIKGNILDKENVRKSIKGCDCVYNFAGIADLDYAHLNPEETISTNIIGNLNIVEACVEYNVKRYVFASSIYVYSDKGSFYRFTKQASELMIEAYNQVYNLHFTILRYGSLYGPLARETNWIYIIIKQALEEKKIVREGDGEELREHINIYDAARATADILKTDFEDKHIIITGNQKMKIKDIMIMVKEMLGFDVELVFKPVAKGDNIHYEITPYTFKPTLAERLVISPHIDLGEGILDCIYKIYNEIKNKSA